METHLAGDGAAPCIPGYRLLLLSRSGAQRSSGGVAVLVHERLGARARTWQPPRQHHTASPYHMWLRIEAHHLPSPLLLAAAYLPPYRSKYGCKSPAALADYFTLLGDETAAALATPGGASVLVAGDWNAHTGSLPDTADHSALWEAAFEEPLGEYLLPCAAADAAAAPELPPRASSCAAAVCEQGRALLQFCQATGLPIANGRLPGDQQGSPTCFSGQNPSVIDYLMASPALLSQATGLRVLSPVPEYQQHRPLELWLAPAASPPAGSAAQCADPWDADVGPPPTLAPPLRLLPDRLPSFGDQLKQPATAAQLQQVAAAASSDPLQAAAQLHAVLYDTAATVFPPAPTGPPLARAPSSAQQLRRRHQPWFDAECAAARQRIRQLLQASVASKQPSHLAKEALRAASNRYTMLRRRKTAAWQRQQGSALLHLQRTDPRAFFKRWKKKHPANPISAAAWVRHFVSVQLSQAFKPTARGRTNPSTAAPATAAAADSAAPAPPPDPELDSDITAADVAAALTKLSPSSASLGPLKAALIQAGREALVPVLSCLFTAVFRSGRFPPEWALGAITPVHKKGDTADPNHYRPITVGHVLGKLYALALNARLTAWLEARGLRAPGQSGFRKGRSTVDNCFILRALAERARARGVKLYCCAVDFSKAFDTVDRPLLWAALRRAGIGGTMLQAVQAMYADVPVCVRTEAGLSGCFQSVLGVKQGCPLSPLLFGVFLDDWDAHLQAALGSAAALPLLAGHTVPTLLFADDMFLVASTAAGLQAQLHCLQAYCDAKKLTVNAAKTQVIILRPGGRTSRLAAGESFTYAGERLEAVSSVKYLGLTLSQLSKARGFASCTDALATAGRQAMFAMRRRAWELGACTVEQQCRLFDVFVTPVLSYGCELWGPDLLLAPGCSSVERVHRWFCRRIQGLPKQASSAIALAELGRWPLHLSWVRQLVRYWNRLQSQLAEPDSLLGWALADNLALMREGADLAAGSACWCRRWLQFLQSAPTASGTFVWLTQLDEGAVVERATAAWLSAAAATPQTPETRPCPTEPSSHLAPAGPPTPARPAPLRPPRPTNKFAYYLAHIRGDLPLSQPAPHLALPFPAHRHALSRFRTSCHDLRIERERYLPQALQAPTHQRTCLQCARPFVEDECHMVFHCPTLDHLRFEFADLFPPDLPPSIPCFLSQDQTRVASFIHACSVVRRRNACMSLAGSEPAL